MPRASCTPAIAIPPSPTAAAQRLTEPERTSPAAKIPGRLVSSGPGGRLLAFQAGAFATSAPVLMNPFSSRSISGGSQVVKNFLLQAGLTADEFVFYDGSGMSRQNLVTPHATAKLLRYASSQPWGTAFRETLPLAGVDGSLSTRFKGTPVEKRVSAKTGLLAEVNALSGYAQTVRGKSVVFSVMVNHHQLTSNRAKELIDQIVSAIVEED